jgi:hypothetical protein
MPALRILLLLLLLLLLCLPALAQAQTRAWLDRDRVALGETATLNIETDQAGVSPPDYTPLEPDFVISGHTSRQSFELRNGKTRSRMLFAVALQPRREGVLAVPPLRVGNTRTQPLSMTVTPAEPARAGGIVFIEAEADQQSPYVQQAVGYVVRLYYATQLISGQLDQEAPPGASLQRVGSDVQYSREIGNRRYTVVERRYLLIPERSGTLAMPPARFLGRGVGGFFDEMFGDGQRALSATGPQRMLDVRAVPAKAPQPWLPLQALSLRYAGAPRTARAGDAVDIVVEAVADGANATQMPELQLPVGDGAQVFAEAPQTDESFVDGRPRVKMTRKFSLVPARAGTLRIAGPRIEWWDVRAGRARTASLPELTLQVAAAARRNSSAVAATAAPPPAEEDDDEQWLRVPGVQGEVRAWALATVIFALLWLATLMWALHRREPAPASSGTKHPADDARAMLPGAGLRALKHALDVGDLGEVDAALCALVTPPAHDLDALQARLDDPAQRHAIGQLQAARWGGGDAVTARAAVRAAFAAGPRWRTDPRVEKPLLPPLYP